MPAQVVELIDVMVDRGQQVLNRFHYVDTTGVADAAILRSDYITDVLPLIVAVQGSNISHISVHSRKVYPTADLVQIQDLTSPVVGTITASAPEPSYVACSIKWSLGPTVVLAGGFTGHILRGGCRVPGPTEGMVNGDIIDPSNYVAFASWFSELKDPGTDAFLLCVASYLSGNPPSRTRQTTVQSYCLVTAASNPSPSTQNTRKVLRGRTF